EGTRVAILDEVKRRVAERPDPPVAPAPPPSAPAVAPPSGPVTWRTDPRLRTPVTLDLKAPTVDDLLRELRQATGVDLSRANDVQHEKPALGSISTRDVPAWQLMEQVATSKRVEGKWETAGTGYRLVSNGTAVQISDPQGPEQSQPTEPNRRRVLVGVLVVNLLVLAGGAGAYW
ncbi:unnamed protein product, partial [Phaeothamnion confervicola]